MEAQRNNSSSLPSTKLKAGWHSRRRGHCSAWGSGSYSQGYLLVWASHINPKGGPSFSDVCGSPRPRHVRQRSSRSQCPPELVSRWLLVDSSTCSKGPRRCVSVLALLSFLQLSPRRDFCFLFHCCLP